MQPEDAPHTLRAFNVVFPPEDTKLLPVHHVNVLGVILGADEFFMTFGTVVPPEVRSIEDLQALQATDQLIGQPLMRIAVSPTVMKQMIDLMTQQLAQFTSLAQARAQMPRTVEEEGSNEDE